jgi:hypothetical protein
MGMKTLLILLSLAVLDLDPLDYLCNTDCWTETDWLLYDLEEEE